MSLSSRSSSVARIVDELDLSGVVQVGRTRNEPVRRLASGLAAVDVLFDGGLPRGRVSEIVGPLSSGKTALLLTLLAAATRAGELVAWVDVADALCPASVAAAGVDLRRLLWVRPPSVRDAARCAELLLDAGGFGVVALDFGAAPPRPLRAHVWPRLMRAAELSHVPLIILAPYRVAGSFSALGVQLRQRMACWQQGVWPLFDGLRVSAQQVRNRAGRVGAVPARFVARPIWPQGDGGSDGWRESEEAIPSLPAAGRRSSSRR